VPQDHPDGIVDSPSAANQIHDSRASDKQHRDCLGAEYQSIQDADNTLNEVKVGCFVHPSFFLHSAKEFCYPDWITSLVNKE